MKEFTRFLYFLLMCVGITNHAQTVTLPVELTYFDFELNGKNVLLSWGTATEVNNAGFEVQRSVDSTWEVLTFTAGAGTSNSPKYYFYEDTSTVIGQSYLYRLKQVDNIGDFKYSDTLFVSVITVVESVHAESPHGFFLAQNYPNPFNPTTVIGYQLPVAGHVSLKLFDLLGREVATLIDDNMQAGFYNYLLSTNNLPAVRHGYRLTSGIYFYKLTAGKYSSVRKMVLLR